MVRVHITMDTLLQFHSGLNWFCRLIWEFNHHLYHSLCGKIYSVFQTIDLLELIQFLSWGRPVQYYVTFWVSFVFPRIKDLLKLEETLIIYQWTNFVGNKAKVQKDREISLQLFNYSGLLILSQCFSHSPNCFVVISSHSH